jgi:hypothetical protein
MAIAARRSMTAQAPAEILVTKTCHQPWTEK